MRSGEAITNKTTRWRTEQRPAALFTSADLVAGEHYDRVSVYVRGRLAGGLTVAGGQGRAVLSALGFEYCEKV